MYEPLHSGAVGEGTIKRKDGIVETAVVGRVTVDVVKGWITDFERLGGSAVWLFAAEECTSYEPAAVDAAARMLSGFHRTHSLDGVVAIIRSPMVRMGARLVSMMSQMSVKVVADRHEAEVELVRMTP